MNRILIPGALLAATFSAGCASGPDVSATQIVRAETTIENAESTGAPEYAANSIEAAREKLTAAKLAAENGDEERATRLAEEAEIDAEVAMAMAQEAEAEQALQEIRSGIDTLRRELEQASNPQGGTL